MWESIWNDKDTITLNAKLVEFWTTIWGQALQWYMKYVQITRMGNMITSNEVTQEFIVKFHKLRTKQQSFTQLKGIDKVVEETTQKYNHIFQDLTSRLTYEIHNTQHKEWFIAISRIIILAIFNISFFDAENNVSL